MAKHRRVSEVARMAHVTVRTLHHYDETGLLVPSARSDAGYRLYSEADLERLHQILLYRELGFPLETIAQVLDEPTLDRRTALQAQRELLVEKRQRLDAVIRAVDRTLESMERGTTMSMAEMFEGFEDLAEAPTAIRAHHAKHAKEAHERWGGTDTYKESMRRAKSYSKEDWEQIQREGGEHEARMVSLLQAGADPEGDDAMAVAEGMRRHIGRWFYPCSHEMHANLADMYEADARFRRYYEDRAGGLARFVARAIRANSRRALDPGGV
jgi:MerR family transcriptional regulator, thiopeptide resistance regulator